MHSFYGQYDLWLIGGVVVFGEFEYGAEAVYSSADGGASVYIAKVVDIKRHSFY